MSIEKTTDIREEDNYNEFEKSIVEKFKNHLNNGDHIFRTDAEDLWEVYLNNLPLDGRQVYNCSCCKNFIRKYGNLVAINEEGEVSSALWEEKVPAFFEESVKKIREKVRNAKVTEVFIPDNEILGAKETGIWGHIHVEVPSDKVNKSRLYNGQQLSAIKSQNYIMLINALNEYSLEAVNQAVTLLESESIYRGHSFLGIATWFKGLHEKLKDTNNERVKDNIIWFHVAMDGGGYSHIRSTVIGTLLDDIKLGLDFESIKRRFEDKVNPGSYMRSQVAPTKGNIVQAEKIIEKLGLAKSLERRYAEFSEIPNFIWRNNHKDKPKEEEGKVGLFSNIIPKVKRPKESSINMPKTIMTWEKFLRTVLPSAENIEVKIEDTDKFMALVTACNIDSENILRWDNPFSWYYDGGIDCEIKRRVESFGGRYEDNEIRCSLIWEGYTDLDLHCVTPTGKHIYFGDKRSACGGWLDIDMNAGGGHELHPVENIRFANNAMKGHYQFYVHNYCERVSDKTAFKVELEVNGKIYTYKHDGLRNQTKAIAFDFDYMGEGSINIESQPKEAAEEWNISGDFVRVNGIINSPNLWGDNPYTKSGNHIFFLLEGCRDKTEGRGRGFFNEMLKPELHEVRKTLEAYTANTKIENMDNATACGVGFSIDNEWNLTLRVRVNNQVRIIKIDRFD